MGPGRLTGGGASDHNEGVIAGTVAALTESEPGVLRCNRLAKPRPGLTGTAPRGGQGVGLFSET